MLTLQRRLTIIISLFLLAACAHQQPTKIEIDWHAFLANDSWPSQHNANTIDHKILALPQELEQRIEQFEQTRPTPARRVEFLLETLFKNESGTFEYNTLQTTTASETYYRRSGNCLSLTLLSYALSQKLGLPGQINEVALPSNWQHLGSHVIVSRHVNLVLRRPSMWDLSSLDSRKDVIIDFDPRSVPSGGFIQPVSEETLQAMYYANKGAEAMLQQHDDQAYAYFRESIRRHAQYETAWLNLGQLYRRHEMFNQAAQAFRIGLQFKPDHYILLSLLAEVLFTQGHDQEANRLRQRMSVLNQYNPYYLHELAIQAQARGEWQKARRHLEKAIEIGKDFPFLHQSLAIVYEKLGLTRQAAKQRSLYQELSTDQPM